MASNNQYGKRLAVNYIDQTARSDPSRTAVYQTVTVDASTETHTVKYRNLANIINNLARWLDELTPVTEKHTRTVGYLAASDVRHLAIVCAAVKSRWKAGYSSKGSVLLLSSRNTAAVHTHLLREVNSSLLVYDEPFRGIAETVQRDGHIQIRAAPSLLECLHYGSIGRDYPYNGTWETAANDPFVILHTTGSTGMPKPVTIPQSSIAATDAHHLVASITGQKAEMAVAAEATTVLLGLPLTHSAGLGLGCFLLLAECALLLPGPDKPVSRQTVREGVRSCPFDAALLPPSVVDDIAEDEHLITELAHCKYIMFGGGAIRLINEIGTTESGSLVQFAVPSENWDCYRFSDELNGIEWRRTGPDSDEYEMVLVRRPAASRFQAVFRTLPHLHEFATRDLFARHPTIADGWVYRGRRDDVVVLSTGENLNPREIEDAVRSSPGIAGAVVFGSAFPQPGLLVELDGSRAAEQVKDGVLAVLENVYAMSPDFARVPADKIIFAESAKPFVRTSKGTTQRKKTIQAYQEDINALYDGPPAVSTETEMCFDFSSKEALATSLASFVANLTDTRHLSPEHDFFEAGMTSQQVEILATSLRRGIQNEPDSNLDDSLLNQDAVYSAPSAGKLASLIFSDGDASLRIHKQNRIERMAAMLERYTASLPRIESSHTSPQHKGIEHILLTGSTGFVGSHLLRELCHRPEVQSITCLDRANPARHQPQPTEPHHIPIKIQHLTADLSAPNLGLEKQTYTALTDSVTTILHCQWPVDFHQPLSFFEPQIQGIVAVTNFAVESTHRPRIIFLSSISTVANWNEDRAVPEASLGSLKHAQTGYGESKLIASLLLHRAGELAGMRGSICRLGQIAGPVDSAGVWPRRDWFPSLLDSSQAIGYLPDSLGAQDTLAWIPVDFLAELIADLALTGERSGETTSYYHFVNPQSAKWADMAPSVIAQLQGECRITSLSDWVRKLEDHAARAASSDTQPSSGVKLIDFYKSLQGRPLDLETCQTRDVIPRLGSIPPVNEGWMRAWLRQWAHPE
ncbi:acetyl-CoA synthetase-like protein [Aspergillus aculeatinus CBS 121060]|uniref:Acetyl-CoA synthetase-like protein n=1 Tax=Aspergillus aculeatinus CBS 121060 TaxID=1448322 RepID=A0ACD1GR66_9EURO|nr:acetyl-CoA synthetase-like protein [Aspergillus aculeatinus CBS 121060]RAH63793.1 acetyl-CoA synthetase-like protein [Aspergillus aculeatinus CBS 121060]